MSVSYGIVVNENGGHEYDVLLADRMVHAKAESLMVCVYYDVFTM